MALQSSGTISFSNIINEFGQPPGKNLGAYRVSQSVGALSNLGLDNNDSLNATIPQSGTIKFSDFYGKKLNIVVNYYTGGTENQPQNGYQRYQANNVTVIGGFRGRPSNPNGKKVYIHVNKTIKNSRNSDRTRCALKTGQSWNGAELRVDVGGSGRIFGAGGSGGRGHQGGRSDSRAESGGNGNSALGLTYSARVNVMGGGVIAGGGGGGGGGGGSRQEDRRRDRSAGGGGGGGGAGNDAGQGGGTSGGGGRFRGGSNGQAGSTFSGGNGGNGGNNENEAVAGRGGNGGSNGADGQQGQDGGLTDRGEEYGRGGFGGRGGSAIRVRNASIISQSGDIRGSTGEQGIA